MSAKGTSDTAPHAGPSASQRIDKWLWFARVT
ncbi:MAG: hypothetical protein ACK4HD_09490, partial [Pannonibacter phragmitetus]